MRQHEWEEYSEDAGPIGEWSYYICKNCGAAIVDLFYKPGRKPRKIVILGSRYKGASAVYLSDDCEESEKRIQQYWEKETKKKGVYKQSMKMYSK